MFNITQLAAIPAPTQFHVLVYVSLVTVCMAALMLAVRAACVSTEKVQPSERKFRDFVEFCRTSQKKQSSYGTMSIASPPFNGSSDLIISETVGPLVVMDDEDFEISAMAGKGFLSRERSFYLKSRPPSVVIIE